MWNTKEEFLDWFWPLYEAHRGRGESIALGHDLPDEYAREIESRTEYEVIPHEEFGFLAVVKSE